MSTTDWEAKLIEAHLTPKCSPDELLGQVAESLLASLCSAVEAGAAMPLTVYWNTFPAPMKATVGSVVAVLRHIRSAAPRVDASVIFPNEATSETLPNYEEEITECTFVLNWSPPQ